MSALTITSLADDLFRLAHDDSSGRPLLHPRATAVGLAAALLAELLYLQKVVVRDGRVVVLSTSAPTDALTHGVLAEVAAEREAIAVGTWLTVLGQDSYEQVSGRLERNGHVRPEVSRRRLVLTQTTFVPGR